jgi:hypothetical protein
MAAHFASGGFMRRAVVVAVRRFLVFPVAAEAFTLELTNRAPR